MKYLALVIALVVAGCAVTRSQQWAADATCKKKGGETVFLRDHIIWVTWFAVCKDKK